MPDNIPAPPSGSIVDSDPLASGSIPPPPSGTIVDADPAQHPSIDLTNPQGQGTYSMRGPHGQTVAVPYGQVQKAGQSGYSFAADADRWRYAKDNAADPQRTTSYTPGANEQTPEGHRAAVYAREDATGPIGQVGIGVAKAAGTILRPISDAASVISGEDNDPNADQTDYTEARNGLQQVGKVGGTLAALAPGIAEAPVATIAGLGTGTVSGLVGKVLGQHLGLNDKQTALLTDLFGIAGGVAGGASAAKVLPGGTSGVAELPQDFAVATGETSPVDAAVSKALNKSGIAAGAPAEEPPAPEDVPRMLRDLVRSKATEVANDAGLTDVSPDSARDAMDSVARGVYAQSKADYRTLDEASGGRWQRFSDAISNIDRKMADVAGVDDEAYDNLGYRKAELETQQAQMVEDMREKGEVDPAIADRATANFKRAMALQDVGRAIKASAKDSPVDDQVIETVDPNGLAQRLQKLNYTPIDGGDSRLVQALGEDHAADLLDKVHNAQIAARAVKDYTPGTPTGKVALDQIIRGNTTPAAGLLGKRAAIDWGGAVKDFEKLPQDTQKQTFGAEVPRVRNYLYGQARRQIAGKILSKLGLYGGAVAAGSEGLSLVRKAISGATR